MAFTLTIPPQSLIRRTVSDTQCHQSSMSAADCISVSTGDRKSTWSIYRNSVSTFTPSADCAKDRNYPPKSPSRSFLKIFDQIDMAAPPTSTTSPPSRKSSWSTCFSETSHCKGLFVANGSLMSNLNFDTNSEDRVSEAEQKSRSESMLRLASRVHSLEEVSPGNNGDEKKNDRLAPPALDDIRSQSSGTIPFKRWMSTLRRKGEQRKTVVARKERWVFDDFDEQKLSDEPLMSDHDHRRSKSGTSSTQFIRAVKSASVTLASTSVMRMSRKGAKLANVMSENTSSRLSENRESLDSTAFSIGAVMDVGALTRSLQRRNILEELINSERGYISDLRSLESSYYDVGKSETSLLPNSRNAIRNMIIQILQLHEELLADLDYVLPDVELSHVEPGFIAASTASYNRSRHTRWHSADFMSVRASGSKLKQRIRHSLDGSRAGGINLTSSGCKISPETVARVARVFNKYMNRFFIYEEYAAQYDVICQEFSNACKVEQKWQSYERGIEVLSNTVRSLDRRTVTEKKSLTFPDLLIKPIQRICKYPLLFADLCKQTPVCDGPESYAEVERVWFRLKETTEEINKATEDDGKRKLIAITWLIQDKMLLESDTSQGILFRRLGHVYACGILHVAYQRPDSIRGQYMMFKLVASVSLKNAAIDRSDNGKGLQCHNAHHSWKVVFDHDRHIYEILMTACSISEENAWKSNIQARIKDEMRGSFDDGQSIYEPLKILTLNMKPITLVLDQKLELSKQKPIQRAATVGPATNMNHVLIKNTQAEKSMIDEQSASALAIGRSQSVFSTKHIPTLVPRRIDRVRLEMALSDIWTRDVLPYPGMLSRRSETSIRASANLMMRKLSMASITSGFSRRSTSHASLKTGQRSNDNYSLTPKVSAPSLQKPKRPPGMRRSTAPVDFHTAPKAFLPEDFDIQHANSASKRRRLLGRSVVECQAFGSSLENSAVTSPDHYLPADGQVKNSKESYRVRSSIQALGRDADPAQDGKVSKGVDSPVQKSLDENIVPNLDGQSEGLTTFAKRSISTSSMSKISPAKALKSSKKKLFRFWY